MKVALSAHKDMPIWVAAFSPDGERLYSAARDKSAAIWDVSKTRPAKLAAISGHEVEVRGLSLSADGNLLATAGNQDMQVRLWDVSDEAPKAAGSLKLSDRVVSVALAPDGKSLAVGGAKGVPATYELKEKKLSKVAVLDTGGRAATSIGYSPEGNRIAGIAAFSGTEDRVLVWNTKGEVQHEFSTSGTSRPWRSLPMADT